MWTFRRTVARLVRSTSVAPFLCRTVHVLVNYVVCGREGLSKPHHILEQPGSRSRLEPVRQLCHCPWHKGVDTGTLERVAVTDVGRDVLWEHAVASLPPPLTLALRAAGLDVPCVLLEYPTNKLEEVEHALGLTLLRWRRSGIFECRFWCVCGRRPENRRCILKGRRASSSSSPTGSSRSTKRPLACLERWRW